MPDDRTKLWYLSQINLFRDLPEDILKEIAETSQMRSFEKGFYISTPHDEEAEFSLRGFVMYITENNMHPCYSDSIIN